MDKNSYLVFLETKRMRLTRCLRRKCYAPSVKGENKRVHYTTLELAQKLSTHNKTAPTSKSQTTLLNYYLHFVTPLFPFCTLWSLAHHLFVISYNLDLFRSSHGIIDICCVTECPSKSCATLKRNNTKRQNHEAYIFCVSHPAPSVMKKCFPFHPAKVQ